MCKQKILPVSKSISLLQTAHGLIWQAYKKYDKKHGLVLENHGPVQTVIIGLGQCKHLWGYLVIDSASEVFLIN